MMDFDLPEEIVALRDVVRRFAAEEIRPYVRQWDEEQSMPPEFLKKLGDLGALGLMIPSEYGGAGLGHLANAVVVEELCRQNGSLGFLMAGHAGLCTTHLLLAANQEQRRKYLPRLATGEWMGAWGLTEPGSGSDAAALQTRAEKDGEGWRLFGQKQFITNASFAQVFVVVARTDPDKERKGISAFIVERGTENFGPGSKEDKLGIRSSDTCTLEMDNAHVGPEALLGELNGGFHDAMGVLERARVGVAAQAVGIARAALEEAITYANERETFGKPIGKHQAIQFMLADMATGIAAARLLTRDAAMALDRDEDARMQGSIAKVFASEVAMKATINAVQIHGGAGCTKDFPVERYMRDAKVVEIGEGTSEIQRMVIARELLKSGAA
ncbi:MAG TPA: acyl-CoA dehydrogenase family protein [Phycisphaerae bacterium]|nr:acyl-CoA dehydrogenase family protein [Phycisphaerae bacterium]